MNFRQSMCGFSLGAALFAFGAPSAFAETKAPAAVGHSASSASDRKTVSITPAAG